MLRFLSAAKFLIAVGVLATPAMAQEPNGYAITDVNQRAGPGTEYPVLVTVPTDAPITILGCLEDYTWCDTTFDEHRGWMRSIYLAGYYDGEYYLLSDYAPDLGYQIVTFDVAAYWDSYYQDEPFYNDQYRVSEARGEGWVDDGVFYDRLSPHGSWTWTQGQYVWIPTGVDAGWRPYTRGRWVYTDYGWTWVSYEPFGWATYHYGRWGFSSRIGWFWVPGNRWGPAWVSWRESDDYLAWAPLPPAYDRGGLSINISIGSIPGYYWSVVPSRYFLSDHLSRYYVRDRARWRRAYDGTRPIGYTKIVNKTVVNNVVNVNYVERHTNEKVVERKVRRTRDWDRAGKVRGDAYEVYRPGLREGRGRRAPVKPRDIEDVAKLSKTRDLARGEATTDDLLAPPEVREAMKKRKAGRARGDQSDAGGLAQGENGARKFDRRLPKGRDAEGPPPSIKKARTESVPAHDLGRPRGGPDGRSGRERGPREKAISVPSKEKGPPSARTRGSKAEKPAGPVGVGKKPRSDEPPQTPAARSKAATRSDSLDRSTKRSRGQPAQSKSIKQGPSGLESPSDRKPSAKKALPSKTATPKDQAPPQAKRGKQDAGKPKASDRKPAARKAPPKEKARPREQKALPQAKRGKQDAGKPKASDHNPAARKAPPKEKAKPRSQERRPKARARQDGPNGPTASGSKRSAPKKQAKPSSRGKSAAKKPSKKKAAAKKRKAPPKAKSKRGAAQKQASSGKKANKNKGSEKKGKRAR